MDLFPDEAVAVGWLRENALPTRVMEAVSRWSLRSADGVIALDHFMGDRLVKKGAAAGRVHVIPIWMHEEVRYDEPGRVKFRMEHHLQDKYVVMYSGNHSPVHPLDTLVQAAKLLQNEAKIHFCFVGGGTEWGKFKRQAQDEKWPNATFLGYQPFEELSGSLSAADLQVVVMGDPLVGIIHPCKVYNFLATRRPFVYIGPEKSHIADLIRNLRLEGISNSFRHGDSQGLADAIRKRAASFSDEQGQWPSEAQLEPWSEKIVVNRIVNLME
jgi:glycosyltransferase involved in cell wall biosynthesis